MYSLESSKQLGFGTTKSILKTLELAPGMMARVSGKVRKDVIRTKEKAAETEAIEEAKLLGLGGEAVTRLIQEKKRTARLLISADLRKEYENMKLFDGNPYIVQCTRIMNKEHVVGLESIELTREGDIEECDRGSADALVASPPKDLAEYMERVSLGRDWALGMAAIHDKGFVHNDVKPANFMIKTGDDEKLHGKVGDLGSLAKDGDSPPGYTFFYLAPEFNREAGKQVGTKQNDVWALGMSLLEVMHGPQNELKMQILRDAQNGYKKVEELQRKLSGTGDPMDKAIASMLEKDPAKRPSMQEIANQLAEILPST
jgi:serine/threonine protein kinase